jgi:hypothetical protein
MPFSCQVALAQTVDQFKQCLLGVLSFPRECSREPGMRHDAGLVEKCRRNVAVSNFSRQFHQFSEPAPDFFDLCARKELTEHAQKLLEPPYGHAQVMNGRSIVY